MPNYKKAISLSLILLAVVIATAMAALSGQNASLSSASNNSVSQDEDQQEQVPIAIYNTDSTKIETANASRSDTRKAIRRAAKNKKYDKSYTVEEVPSFITITPRSAHWVADVPAIPIAQSNVVVIGEVVNAEAFLSTDKTGIYSEFTINVYEVLKNDARAPINQGQQVVADRAGGAVKFPSGQVQRIHVFMGQRMPELGQRYLFFLKRNEAAEDFSILTGYKLEQDRIISLDNIQPYKSYTGTDVNKFLDIIRSTIRLDASQDATTQGGKN